MTTNGCAIDGPCEIDNSRTLRGVAPDTRPSGENGARNPVSGPTGLFMAVVKKYLCFAIHHYGEGGMQRSVSTLCAGLKSRGRDVSLVVGSRRSRDQLGLFSSIETRHLLGGTFPLTILSFVKFFRTSPGCDYLIVQNSAMMAGALCAKWLMRSRVPLALYFRNPLTRDMELERSPFAGMYHGLTRFFIRRFIGQADALFFNSQGTRQSLEAFAGPRNLPAFVLNNPVIRNDFEQRAAQPVTDFRKQPGEKLLVGMGRLHYQKNFALLIRAHAILRQTTPVRTLILGEGPERGRLEALISELKLQDEVRLVGYRQNPLPYLAQADVFVLSSSFEGFGNVIVEALALGVNVVATDCPGGPAEILANGKYGSLATVDDEDLAGKIALRLEQPLPAAFLKNRAEEYREDKVIDRFASLFDVLRNQVSEIEVERCSSNPVISSQSSPSLGDNINGPSVIRVPEWVRNPLGRYYMYFAHHSGKFIRLAHADDPEGPWTVYEPGTLKLDDAKNFKGHIASPDVHVDYKNQVIRMYFHGPARHSKGQWTGVATSTDGIRFEVAADLLGKYYFRVWSWKGYFYALAKSWNSGWGELYRSRDGLTGFESRGNFLQRVRHSAVLLRGHCLLIFHTRVGDAPERILVSTLDLRIDWREWWPTDALEVLRPERVYEGAGYAIKPSLKGPQVRVQQLRDPCIFEDDGRVYLFYAIAGEEGIAVARLNIRMI
jgi:glycosyltransferase involved in cell wall biosynthesis